MFLIDFLVAVVQQTFWVVYDAGLFVLIGFAVAGALHVLLDAERIVRRLGDRSLKSAAVAALIGAPIPLCSCGVLPTALELRRKGASREATLSFLISTPETGVDSIAVTYAFFGPLLTIVRPLVAVITGIVAAALSLRRWPPSEPEPPDPGAPGPAEIDALAHGHLHGLGGPPAAAPHTHADGCEAGGPPPDGAAAPAAGGRFPRLRRAARYAFVDLFDDLAFWLVFAFVLSGILGALLPDDFFSRYSPSSLVTMAVMVGIGIPLYVCASASTPLAAVFVAKGASMGAALVFLLCGPATNAATMGAITRILGRPFLRIYLGAIVGVALAAGLLLDAVAPGLGAGYALGARAATESQALGLPKTLAAVAMVWLLATSLRRTGVRQGLGELRENGVAAWQGVRGLRPRDLVRSRVIRWGVAAWALAVLAGGFTRVPPGTRALLQRFGAPVGTPLEPGLAYAIPGVDAVTLVRVDAVRERPIGYRIAEGSLARTPVPDESQHLTGDENVIDLHAEAQFRVSDPVRYRLGAERPDEILGALVRSRLVEAIAGRPIDLVYTNERQEVEAWLLARVREDAAATGIGVDVLAVRLLDVHAPANVHDAFRDVASAHEDRLTAVHRANEYAASQVALARGEAARRISDAEGFAVSRLARAEGDASSFTALATEAERAPELTRDRLRIETAERVLPGVKKIVRPAGAQAKSVEFWLRQGAAPLPPAAGAPAATPSAPASPPAAGTPAPAPEAR